MKLTSVISSCAVSLIVSSSLLGCGEDPGAATTPAATTPEKKVTDPSTTTTTTNKVADKDTIYVVLRMDDIGAGEYVADRMTDAIEWSLEKKIKFNLGLMAKDWPADCNSGCADSPAVKALSDAYNDGAILGTGGSELLEIGCHSFDHEGWPGFYTDKARVEKDLKQGVDILKAAFPKASLRTFTPPQNLATMDVVKVAAEHGMDILTSQGTMSCGGEYVYFPCEDCRPKDDVFITADGFQKIPGTDSFSTPTGSANSDYSPAANGISAKDTLGVDDCGCIKLGGVDVCGMVANAKGNAKKANGVQWTVLMMHPQTEFPDKGTYRNWLDEFHEAVEGSGLKIQFIHFQDLVELTASAASAPAQSVVI